MSGLDSVFFSIDTKNGIIFNADSLPKGTDVKKLKTKIQFYNAVSVAEYTMENGTHRTGTSDYRTQPNDTIDFTGDVSLKVVSGDSKTQLTYRIKVNVHKMDPDSLAYGLRWPWRSCLRALPRHAGRRPCSSPPGRHAS